MRLRRVQRSRCCLVYDWRQDTLTNTQPFYFDFTCFQRSSKGSEVSPLQHQDRSYYTLVGLLIPRILISKLALIGNKHIVMFVALCISSASAVTALFLPVVLQRLQMGNIGAEGALWHTSGWRVRERALAIPTIRKSHTQDRNNNRTSSTTVPPVHPNAEKWQAVTFPAALLLSYRDDLQFKEREECWPQH